MLNSDILKEQRDDFNKMPEEWKNEKISLISKIEYDIIIAMIEEYSELFKKCFKGVK